MIMHRGCTLHMLEACSLYYIIMASKPSVAIASYTVSCVQVCTKLLWIHELND